MSQRSDYLIQILDKIGGPLIDAVASHSPAQDAAAVQADATTLATLLGKVVEISISMNQVLDLKPEEAQNDALRAALAALAGPLVAAQYRQSNQVPSDNDLKRLQATSQAVLTFADNFTPSPEMAQRLEKIAADGAPVDAHQVNIQYVHAFIPVVNAIAAFSFGQSEQKLIIDVSDRLVKRAIEMREGLMPELSGDDQKLAELAIMRSLAGIYAACHKTETQRLTGSEQTPESASMDTVWNGFETRASMLEVVARNVMPNGTGMSAAAPAPQDTADSSGTASPMGFFAKPKTDEAPAAAPPAAPVPPPVSDPSPPVPPPAQPVAQPPETTPPEAAPVPETPPATDNSAGEATGNPMSFFTKKDESD